MNASSWATNSEARFCLGFDSCGQILAESQSFRGSRVAVEIEVSRGEIDSTGLAQRLRGLHDERLLVDQTRLEADERFRHDWQKGVAVFVASFKIARQTG